MDKRATGKLLINIFLMLMFVKSAQANFNLYLPKSEVKRLLGLPSELFYVREGVVNDYAMSWTVKIPPEVHSLIFSWEAIGKKPVLYNLAVWTNHSSVPGKGEGEPLLTPSTNISIHGVIPRQSSSFLVELPCSGRISGEVEVVLNINVTSAKANTPPTELYFSRKKICIEGIAGKRHDGNNAPYSEGEVADEEGSETGDDLPQFAYVVSIAGAFVLVVGLVTTVACWRIRRLSSNKKCSFEEAPQPVLVTSELSHPKSTQHANLTPGTLYKGPSCTYTIPSSVTGNTYTSLYKFPFQSVSSQPPGGGLQTNSSCSGIYESSYSYSSSNNSNQRGGTMESMRRTEEEHHLLEGMKNDCAYKASAAPEITNLKEKFGRLQMDRERVRLTEIIQEGSVGKIYRGWLQREHPELDQQVLIKSVRENASPHCVSSLCQEGILLSGFCHQNILSLVGMSFVPNTPPFLIFPDTHSKNFRNFLRQRQLVSVCEMVELSLQAVKATLFLNSNHLFHGDIAARNCSVTEGLHLRLGDCALSRDFFPDDYETPPGGSDGASIPMRWMAPESLEARGASWVPNTQTDVWSLGILLWEITSMGERPYLGISNRELLPLLREGLRLSQPLRCPDDLMALMTACWTICPDRRPKTIKMQEFLIAFKQSLDSFV